MDKRNVLFVLFCFWLVGQNPLCAQETTPAGDSNIKAFRGIAIGLGIEQVKELLKKDPYFNYRGDPDVYFLPGKEQQLIECSGNGFIRRAYFQFVEKKLYALIIDLDEGRIDFFSLLETLQNKYGLYKSFSPAGVVWETNGIRLALEKPLTIKYIDLAVFEKLKEAGKATENAESRALDEFLKEF